jgi:pseudouridine-5'-phosphate glycosidase
MPTVGMTGEELSAMLAARDAPPGVAKANAANLGLFIHRRQHAATTVSATMELAAAAGVRVFATGGIGGVHKGYATLPDVSADLAALARHPVAVVASGVKSLLDVAATREVLEAIGVCVVGFATDEFPAFFLRRSGLPVDARFDDEAELSAFLRHELARRASGVLVCNPIPEADELDPGRFGAWLTQAEKQAAEAGATGRGVTPAVLARLHAISDGATLRANLALVRSNAALAGRLARAI